MDVIFRKGEATAREVWSALGETRISSTIRQQLGIPEERGHVTHREEGVIFDYRPIIQRETAASSALDRLVDTFFQDPVAGAVSGLLGERADRL